MSTAPKSRSLFNCAALVISMFAVCSGAARASEYEIVYRAILNEGARPLAPFASLDSAPFAPGTPLTITAVFDLSTARQWNTGAWFYTAPSATFLIGSSTYEAEDPLEILLSDPSWQTLGGPYPYSAGFLDDGPPLGSINSLFGASTNAFDSSNPSPTSFYEYEHNFEFTGGAPLTLFVAGASGGGQLVIYNTGISDVTAAIFPVPELSTWAMMAVGFAGLGMGAGLRAWRTQTRVATQ
jgi:hypothetical protein